MLFWSDLLWPRKEDSVTQESHGGPASAPSSVERTTAADAAVFPAGDTAAMGPGATAAEAFTAGAAKCTGATAAVGPSATAGGAFTLSPAAVNTGATIAAVGAVKPAGTGRPVPGSVLIASTAKPSVMRGRKAGFASAAVGGATAAVGVPPRPGGSDFPCAATSDEDWKYCAMDPFDDGGGLLPRTETWRYRH